MGFGVLLGFGALVGFGDLVGFGAMVGASVGFGAIVGASVGFGASVGASVGLGALQTGRSFKGLASEVSIVNPVSNIEQSIFTPSTIVVQSHSESI